MLVKCLNQLSVSQCKLIMVTLNINGNEISMECDTGVQCLVYVLHFMKSYLRTKNQKK